ncbi:MAG: desulfoferrodoxin [Clostridium sp.]|jgi:superoxide reductase|uniref:desulfoferrodoxin n=1 Tax=Clostridium sp. TaxID=1506 RepID=UPI0025BDA6E2|nr:desulfoferrodoxin [Clostridium sp.]MCH3964909.1 desulfoferrodoxin [Clostridium sp.]MCI1716597.1 desulfoferrodoxin [Clostridium sp.]MCI1800921.1 desulfoferrodoxin [Clostridium sp.]MCI1814774.1 desulfoferrodoxin [Clostridium sp.]MCI1871668.1 desulfoferrodoxin [Clostridium sp.]
MIEVKQVYKCEVCGNIVEVLSVGGGNLTCCRKQMTLLEENTVDAALEKHVPVIEKTADGVLVKVGSVEHPMTEAHYIQWIEVHTDNNKIYRKYLTPDDKPQAEFKLDEKVTFAREYCNLHGLWKSK